MRIGSIPRLERREALGRAGIRQKRPWRRLCVGPLSKSARSGAPLFLSLLTKSSWGLCPAGGSGPPALDAAVESHSCAKNAQEWGTHCVGDARKMGHPAGIAAVNRCATQITE